MSIEADLREVIAILAEALADDGRESEAAESHEHLRIAERRFSASAERMRPAADRIVRSIAARDFAGAGHQLDKTGRGDWRDLVIVLACDLAAREGRAAA